MVCLGGFIGFDPNTPTQTAGAEETRIRWVDVPETRIDFLSKQEKRIDVDLQKDHVSFSGDIDNATVTISTDVETRPEYLTKVVEKPVYIESTIKNSRLFNQLYPISRCNPVKGWNSTEEKRGPQLGQ